MSTEFFNDQWRIPSNENQNKVSNYSMDFNGSSDKIEVQDASNEFGFSNNSFSLSAWVFIDSNTTQNGLIAKRNIGTAAANKMWYFEINTSSQLRFLWYNTVGGSSNASSTDTIPLNTWTHVVVTSDGTGANGLNFYINGSVDSGGSKTGPSSASSIQQTGTQLWVGARGGNSSAQYTSGKIDQVAVFDYELSASQVSTLYGGGTAVTNPMSLSPKPIAYYQLGDQSVSTGPTSDYLVPNNSLSDYVFNFGATNESVNLGNSFNYPSVVADPWTISFWVKPTNATSTGIIFSGYSVANNRGFYLNMRNWPNPTPADRRLQCIIRSNSSVYTSVVTPSLALNEWTHVAVCYGGGGSGNFPYSFSVYFNNSPVSLVVAGGNLGTPAGSVGPNDNKDIGQVGNTSYLTNAELSELSFLKYKLSANQVDTLYNNGKPGDISSLSPLAWYKLNSSEIFNSTSTEWSVDNNAYPSVYKSSLNFNGNNDTINLSNNSVFNLGNSFTISGWFNFSSNKYQGLISFDATSGGSPRGWFLFQIDTNNDIRLFDGTTVFTLKTSYTTTNQWDSFIITYDGTDLVFYINGNQESTQAVSVDLQTNGNDAQIGNNQFASGRFFDGEMSNIALWNVGLTSPQVTTLYNNGTPEASISHSPVSWYKLDNTTTGIQDSAGSNNGTNNGATEYAGFVNALAGESSGMDSSNLVVSDLQQTSGYSPYALSFDGVDDYLNAGSASYLNGLSEFSISVWINLPTAADNKTIISDWNYNTSPFGHFALKTWNTSGSNFGLLLFIKQPSDAGSNGVSIPAVLTQGNWHNVVFRYDSGTVTCYVNGSVVAVTVSGTIPTTLTSQDGILTIGNWPGLSQYWPGKLSNIALWSLALTQANATEIYNQGVPGDISSLSPLAWWQIGSNSSFNPNPTGTEGAWTCLDEIGTNNAVSAGNMTNDAITDGPGYSASGLGTSSIDIKGDAPYSTANGLSENMDVLDRTTDIPS